MPRERVNSRAYKEHGWEEMEFHWPSVKRMRITHKSKVHDAVLAESVGDVVDQPDGLCVCVLARVQVGNCFREVH